MATYTIQVLNLSGFEKSYVIYTTPPAPSGEGYLATTTRVWATLNNIPTGDRASITFVKADFANRNAAARPDDLDAGVVQPGDFSTSSQPTTFHIPQVTGFYVADALYVPGQVIDHSTVTSNGVIDFGPSPIATSLSHRNDTVTPAINFYVAEGAYSPGQAIEHNTASVNAAAIHFKEKSQTNAIVTHEADGLFSVTYY